jgi:hypothetical protein
MNCQVAHRSTCTSSKCTTTPPFVKRAYPIAFTLRPEVEKVIQQMLQLGVMKREASPFASPMMTVIKKKDGTVRICLDARWINQQMVADCEAPRPLEDLFHSLQSIMFMSAIDLRSSYWQIPLSPESTQYTAFLFNGQSYTYQVLPFGLKTAVGSFNRAMDVIFGPEVREFTLNYIDDVLIVLQTFKAHLVHLRRVLQRLQVTFRHIWVKAACKLCKKRFTAELSVPKKYKTTILHVKNSKAVNSSNKNTLRKFLGNNKTTEEEDFVKKTEIEICGFLRKSVRK